MTDKDNLVPGIECYFQIYEILYKGTIVGKDEFIEGNYMIVSDEKNWSVPLESIFIQPAQLKDTKVDKNDN